MKKCVSEEVLLMLAEKELDADSACRIREHLRSCERCRDLFEEYERTLTLLSEERIDVPGQAEWARLRETVGERLGRKGAARPAWVYGVAGAAACVLMIILAVRPDVLRRHERLPEVARSEAPTVTSGKGVARESELTREPELAQESEATREERPGTVRDETAALEETGPPGAQVAQFTLSLASLSSDELSELDDLTVVSGGLRSSDVMLLDLTDAEIDELIKDLESTPSLENGNSQGT
ncbi:MAG: hypothetical protein V2A71_11380 [Candidatus Eisenbacteria bacterium]